MTRTTAETIAETTAVGLDQPDPSDIFWVAVGSTARSKTRKIHQIPIHWLTGTNCQLETYANECHDSSPDHPFVLTAIHDEELSTIVGLLDPNVRDTMTADKLAQHKAPDQLLRLWLAADYMALPAIRKMAASAIYKLAETIVESPSFPTQLDTNGVHLVPGHKYQQYVSDKMVWLHNQVQLEQEYQTLTGSVFSRLNVKSGMPPVPGVPSAPPAVGS
jgi:hypothetical protein